MTRAHGNAAQAYRRNAVMTATKEKLLLMFYEGAIRHIDRAHAAIEERQVNAAGEALSKSFAIVSELRTTLDRAQGGEIAANLDRLYRFVLDRLVDANRNRITKPLLEARSVLSTLKEGWDAILGAG